VVLRDGGSGVTQIYKRLVVLRGPASAERDVLCGPASAERDVMRGPEHVPFLFTSAVTIARPLSLRLTSAVTIDVLHL
jgi:hypothetical protein